jgi:hypothetical protein
MAWGQPISKAVSTTRIAPVTNKAIETRGESGWFHRAMRVAETYAGVSASSGKSRAARYVKHARACSCACGNHSSLSSVSCDGKNLLALYPKSVIGGDDSNSASRRKRIFHTKDAMRTRS